MNILSTQFFSNLPVTAQVIFQHHYLYEEGQTVSGIYYLKQGCVATIKSYQPKDVLLSLIPKNQLVGLSNLKAEKYLHSAVALCKSEVVFIGREIIEEGMANDFEFSMHVIQALCKEINESEDKRLKLLQKSIRYHLIYLLMDWFHKGEKENGQMIQFPCPLTDIARLLDTSTANFFKILTELEASGLIKVAENQIQLIQPQQLERLLNN